MPFPLIYLHSAKNKKQKTVICAVCLLFSFVGDTEYPVIHCHSVFVIHVYHLYANSMETSFSGIFSSLNSINSTTNNVQKTWAMHLP